MIVWSYLFMCIIRVNIFTININRNIEIYCELYWTVVTAKTLRLPIIIDY
jgi:hypothetical protein